MTEITHQKCTRCKCHRELKLFLNKKGRKFKACQKCRDYSKLQKYKNKCIHGRQKSRCKECGGCEICIHGKLKSYCKECGGSQICIHGKRRSICKECGGGQICIHRRIRSICKECGGSQICEHLKERRHCQICDPVGHLCHTVSVRVRLALKCNKTNNSFKYLGISITEYKKYIENQFKEGMTWENHGEWHIDHKIPLKYKQDGVEPSLEETIKRLHYTNTWPMWASENLSKGNKFISV